MKQFRVEVWFDAIKTNLVLMASNSAQALVLAKRIYKNGTVISAKEIK